MQARVPTLANAPSHKALQSLQNSKHGYYTNSSSFQLAHNASQTHHQHLDSLSDPQEHRLNLIPDGRSGKVGLIHVQKSGGTALYLACARQCHARRRLMFDLREIGQDPATLSKGKPCGCRPLFDRHWTFEQLAMLQGALNETGVPLHLITMLRDPVERVVSGEPLLSPHALRVLLAPLVSDRWEMDTPTGATRVWTACMFW